MVLTWQLVLKRSGEPKPAKSARKDTSTSFKRTLPCYLTSPLAVYAKTFSSSSRQVFKKRLFSGRRTNTGSLRWSACPESSEQEYISSYALLLGVMSPCTRGAKLGSRPMNFKLRGCARALRILVTLPAAAAGPGASGGGPSRLTSWCASAFFSECAEFLTPVDSPCSSLQVLPGKAAMKRRADKELTPDNWNREDDAKPVRGKKGRDG